MASGKKNTFTLFFLAIFLNIAFCKECKKCKEREEIFQKQLEIDEIFILVKNNLTYAIIYPNASIHYHTIPTDIQVFAQLSNGHLNISFEISALLSNSETLTLKKIGPQTNSPFIFQCQRIAKETEGTTTQKAQVVTTNEAFKTSSSLMLCFATLLILKFVQ